MTRIMTSILYIKQKSCWLYIISIVNLLLMHYYIMITCRLEEAIDPLLCIDNLLGVICDVTIVLSITLLITWGKQKTSLFITAIITLLWSFSNILYSRFFHHYISLSAIGQVGNLTDGFMFRNIMEGVLWMDCYYLIILIFILWLYFRSPLNTKIFNPLSILLKWPLCLVIINIVFHLSFCILTPGLRSFSYFKHRLYVRHIELLHSSAEPNWSSFHRGTIRHTFIPIIYQAFANTELTEEQRTIIKTEYSNHQERISNSTNKIKDKNLIFIIVESYLSTTSDLIVDGKEVTPFLNSLKHDSTIYYNGQLTPNITVGESSDGQFLYMTGMLPLRSEVTVTKAKYSELPGLPKLLKQEGMIKEAQMVIPTLPSMWEQESMCKRYGFDQLYSSADYKNGKYWYLSDQQIFEYAFERNLTAKQPFLSVVLTMTMHQPYKEPMDPYFIVKDISLTEKYRNYLSTCHYTDKQIKWYFEQLKKNGLYDNSVIVIVADHHAHASLFDMAENDISSDIPLYIVNGNINSTTGWQGKCNQLDVYTTLLDIWETKNSWKGLGHTLFTNDYHNSIKPYLWIVSEQIIIGNYFKQ